VLILSQNISIKYIFDDNCLNVYFPRFASTTPKSALPKDFKKYYLKWKASEITSIEFTKLLNIGRTTLYSYIKEYKA